MDIDDESFSQINQHAKPSMARSQSFLHSDSDTASFKSVNEFIVDDKDSQSCCTDEESYLYKELFEDAQEVSSSVNKSKAHQEEETPIEDMSIDDERYGLEQFVILILLTLAAAF
ncbi:hypothetical protein G6F42_017783 [Rhizopus arrhizus]|nr:hypothetical protein G6F42_017783 [Rhizopus arrhizus]